MQGPTIGLVIRTDNSLIGDNTLPLPPPKSCTLHWRPLHFARLARAGSNFSKLTPTLPDPSIALSASSCRWLMAGHLWRFRRWQLHSDYSVPTIVGRYGTREAFEYFMKNKIVIRTAVICVATAALTGFLLVGCDREVSNTKSSSESSSGTVKTKEKTVTQAPDGTTTKTDESKSTTPPEKP